jgi:hypothetical protein
MPTTVRDPQHSTYTSPASAPREAEPDPAQDGVQAAGRFRVPAWVWVVGLIAAAVHMAPYLRALAVTPAGYEFTGNLSLSPDYMQYRVWMRQTQIEGPIVSDVFTTEANEPHLPVPLYWTFGKVASWTGVSPEWTYAWFGALLAVAFAVVLWLGVSRFIRSSRARAWTFGALMFGGGLGGALRLLEDFAWARGSFTIQYLLLQPLRGEGGTPTFESYRGNYIVQALLDTHFLAFWLITTAAVLVLHSAVRRPSAGRLAIAAAVFAFGTFLHIYEGLTLLAITWGALAAVAFRDAAPRRTLLVTGAVCTGAVVLTLLPIFMIARQSGLPTPSWRGETLVFSVFVLAYPLALGLLVWGFGRYWREAGVDEAFLVGWAVACAAIVLSGPFFPYPDRGTMTLQIPLFLIGAGIWFARRPRVGPLAAVVVVLLLGSTPFYIAKRQIARTAFDPAESFKWIGPAEQRVLSALRERASRTDVLVADQPSLRWIAPVYPGVHYAGHFFLTVDFGRKQEALRRFYESANDAERRAFLDEWGVRWLFVDERYDAESFVRLPGVTLVERTPAGSLFEVARTAPAAS